MTQYKEIFRLEKMLKEAGIPYQFCDLSMAKGYPSYKIVLNKHIDAVQNRLSYGQAEDLIEIRGAITKDEKALGGGVLGYLTAEEVFERFKYCYEHDTSTYEKENDKRTFKETWVNFGDKDFYKVEEQHDGYAGINYAVYTPKIEIRGFGTLEGATAFVDGCCKYNVVTLERDDEDIAQAIAKATLNNKEETKSDGIQVSTGNKSKV